jgi:hypothetical protein
MTNKNARIVFKTPDDKWVNKRFGATKAAGVYDTQREAIEEAAKMLGNSGGGELVVKGMDGKIRSKDTIPPGNDPCPPKDKEH